MIKKGGFLSHLLQTFMLLLTELISVLCLIKLCHWAMVPFFHPNATNEYPFGPVDGQLPDAGESLCSVSILHLANSDSFWKSSLLKLCCLWELTRFKKPHCFAHNPHKTLATTDGKGQVAALGPEPLAQKSHWVVWLWNLCTDVWKYALPYNFGRFYIHMHSKFLHQNKFTF